MKKTFSILFPHESIKYTSSVSPSSTFSAKWFSVPKATIWKILASNLQKIQLLCCVAGAWSDMFIACPIMNSWFSEDFLFVFGDTSCFFSTSLFPFTWQEFNYRSKENHLLFHFLACTHNLISQNLFMFAIDEYFSYEYCIDDINSLMFEKTPNVEIDPL